MAETKHDAAFFFDALVAKLNSSKIPDAQDRIVAHIRTVTGHTTLPSYHQSTDLEDERVQIYMACIKAVLTGDFSALHGQPTAGKPVSRDDLADFKAAQPAPQPAPAPKPEAQPLTGVDPKLQAVVTAIVAAIGQGQAGGKIDEREVRTIAEQVLDQKFGDAHKSIVEFSHGVAESCSKMVKDYLKSIPPRDVIEIHNNGKLVNTIEGRVHKQVPTLAKMLLSRNAQGYSEFIYVYSAPGAGKTRMTKDIAACIGGLPYYAFPCGPTATEGKMLGFNNIANGTFVAGWLYKAFRDGGLVALDEIDLADASVLGACNSIENEEFTFGNGECVQRHKDFHLIAFANTIGTGATGGFVRNKLDAATLNRFTHVKLEYDEDLERGVFGNSDWASYVIKVREYVTKNCNGSIYITPRATRKGAAYLATGHTPAEVADMVLFGLCSPEVKQTILSNVGAFGQPAKKGKK